MTTLKRFSKRGFTLVELMIVVAIIGVLAALAIYGVRKYLASAKTAEAKNSIGAITRGAVSAYERETVKSELVAEGSASAAVSHALCASAANTVPAAIASVKGVKYQPNSAANTDFQTGDGSTGWKCVRFEIGEPIYYLYSYTKGAGAITANPANSDANGFEASATGDLNGDGVVSQFARTGEVNTSTGTVRTATQIFINNEFE